MVVSQEYVGTLSKNLSIWAQNKWNLFFKSLKENSSHIRTLKGLNHGRDSGLASSYEWIVSQHSAAWSWSREAGA